MLGQRWVVMGRGVLCGAEVGCDGAEVCCDGADIGCDGA